MRICKVLFVISEVERAALNFVEFSETYVGISIEDPVKSIC